MLDRELARLERMMRDGEVEDGEVLDTPEKSVRAMRLWIDTVRGADREARELLRTRKPRRSVPADVRAFVMYRDSDHCGICGELVEHGEPMQIDHHVPLSRCGTDDPDNLRVAHARCNLKKGARLQ